MRDAELVEELRVEVKPYGKASAAWGLTNDETRDASLPSLFSYVVRTLRKKRGAGQAGFPIESEQSLSVPLPPHFLLQRQHQNGSFRFSSVQPHQRCHDFVLLAKPRVVPSSFHTMPT